MNQFSKLKHQAFIYCCTILLLLIIWQLGAMALNKPILPTPRGAVTVFIDLMPKVLWKHFIVSSYRVFLSIGIAMFFAVPIGLYLGRKDYANKILSPLIYLVYPIPKSVFFPLLVVLMGLGDLPKIFLITIIIFFQILVTARDGAKGIPEENIYSMRSLGATEWQIYRHVIWPATLPDIFTSLRISIGTAIAVLFLAETFASTDGLGYFILNSMGRQDYEAMFAGIMGMSVLGFVAYVLVDWIEGRLCIWQRL